MTKEGDDQPARKKAKIDKSVTESSSDLTTLTHSTSASSFHPDEPDGFNEELISKYQKDKGKIAQEIESSKALPAISEEDLTKGAKIEQKKVNDDLDKALTGNSKFYQKFDKSEDFVKIIKQLKETVTFYKFSLAPKKDQEQLMQKSNAELVPKNSLLDDLSEESKQAGADPEIEANKAIVVDSDLSESVLSKEEKKWAARPDIDPEQRGEGSSKSLD